MKYRVFYKDGQSEDFESLNQIEDNRANNPIIAIVPLNE